MAMLLLMSLCIITVIQLTSSQSTYDVTQQENDVSSCGRSDQVQSQLVTSVSQMQTAMSQLVTTVSRMETVISQLQGEVAGLQAIAGIPE